MDAVPLLDLNDISVSPAAHPSILEGRWLGQSGEGAMGGTNPVSFLEGGRLALDELPSWLGWHTSRYPGGAAIGFFSYELARHLEALSLPAEPSLPDLSFAYYPELARLRNSTPSRHEDPELPPADFRTNFGEESYEQAVETIRKYIAAGDIYQANLTQQFSVNVHGNSSERIYRWLSRGHAAFRAFLRSPDWTIISNSPERFFRVAGGDITASPIKGTIARGRDAAEDAVRAGELLSSRKDRAENIMIVDLLRNDLGRVCEYGSVRVKLFELISLPHLFHLVSHVRGKLRAGAGVLDILRALFPCGSITGAPKIRAIEILSEIEQVPRGISMGAIGIILGTPGSPQFEMDFNVAIRTMVIQEGTARFNVGGGIVFDSDPRAEHEEMMLKARPLLEALGIHGPSELRKVYLEAAGR